MAESGYIPQTSPPRNGGNGNSGKVLERIKSLSYSAATNKLLLDVEVATTEGSVKTGTVGEIEIVNTGNHPAFAILAYRLWTAEGVMSTESDGATNTGVYHVHYLLKPGQAMIVPDAPAIISDAEVAQFDGTAVGNKAITDDGLETGTKILYSDSGTTIDDAGFEAADTEITVDDGDFFRVNDLIQFGINTTTVTKIEICRVTAIATDVLTLERALYGTTANDKDAQTHGTRGVVDNATIHFPFFNTYGNKYDRYAVVQTDAGGRFHATNLFGVGRAATNLMGITPGSFSAKFYNAGYQNLTDDGDITSSTNSGLTASITYYLSVAIDGGTTDAITFTTDSSNVNMGGTNGVISKLQASIDALYYDPDVNGYEKKATVGIVDGNVRITSGQRLSTSAISVTTNTAGTVEVNELFDGQTDGTGDLGRFKAVIPPAVDAKLPDDVVYDRVTYDTSPNTGAFCYDDGNGRLSGMASGSLNYETGEINMTGCPANAEFVYSCLHTSPFSGRTNATNAAKMNSIKAIYGNMPNQKATGELTITRR